MRRYDFVAVDVFTETPFGGNPLAVFQDAQGISDGEMQQLAIEFGWSEIAFVLPATDPANTARVRIFTPSHEMPFAGHPNVGTGWVLASLGRIPGDRAVFEEIAGLVEVRIVRTPSGEIAGARVEAPEPLSVGFELPPAAVAACAGLEPGDILLGRHAPLVASVGHPFVFAEVGHQALRRAAPDPVAFRSLLAATPRLEGRLSVHLYAKADDALATRMFAPLTDIPEDPATGAANAALAALLLSFGDEPELALDVAQGVEMGRPSRLAVTARRTADGIRASVAGSCVAMMEGAAILP
jgi:trans-2,3-dihydro-3-hydroxyanthranilate isomerase